jgi:hypothetical protein
MRPSGRNFPQGTARTFLDIAAPKRTIRFHLKPAIFIRRPAVPANAGGFDVSLFVGEIAIVLWLWHAVVAFVGGPLAWWPDAPGLALAAAAGSWRLGLHRRPQVQPISVLLRRAVCLVPLLAVIISVAVGWRGPQVTPAFALWIGAAITVLFLAFRLGFWAAQATWPGQPGEILRWLLVGAAGVVLLLPFYGRHGFGSGDVYWYVVMLADFTAQIHHGVFPVWVGQSEYAFNGAVSPLRLAPLFQYSGAFWDLVTCHALEPNALVNAIVCASGLATAASAYFAVRTALARRANVACLLALLWVASPGVLAPAYSGYQYMQWTAMPFLPLLLWGCWRLWARDDRTARLAIVIAVAGMMLAHTPTGLWGGLIAAGMYLLHLLARRNWAAERGQILGMAGLFLILGGFAIGSALTIDNATRLTGAGKPWSSLPGVFPANFRPIDVTLGAITTFQLGYTLLAGGIAALALLAWLRPRGAIAFALAVVAFVPLTIPIPGVTAWIWNHAPAVVMTITNEPLQRLFEFWGIVIVFALVLAESDPRLGLRSRPQAVLLLVLAAGSVWTAREAAKLIVDFSATFSPPEEANIALRPENLVLARYAYASFEQVPGYASHAHMDPLLENRLLDRGTLKLMAANADAAAPKVRPDSDLETLPRLAQAGLWVATSDNHQRFYQLSPPLRLQPGQAYALRVDFVDPGKAGVLQIANRELFREYLLPDSGVGISTSALAFGSLPSSSSVAALEQNSPAPAEPSVRFIAPTYAGEQFAFARFWLFTYDRSNLPVRVSSWIPYRAETETAIPAYLETPRIWQRGWRAEVNGRRVRTQESPQHLVMIPLAPGTSAVTLTFRAPFWLSCWFWLCLAAWTATGGWAMRWVLRRATLT